MELAPIQFWFDLASTYSYVAAMRIEGAAAEAGVTVQWKPFLLGPIFTAQLGIKGSPFNVHPVRGRYMWRDVERLCERWGLPWNRPSAFPRNSVLAGRVACAVSGEAWQPELVRAIFRANFAEDRDIADPQVIADVVAALGHDPARVLADAGSPAIKERLRTHTAQAMDLGIFGAPNLVAGGGELFFGQDRIADALEWHRRHATSR